MSQQLVATLPAIGVRAITAASNPQADAPMLRAELSVLAVQANVAVGHSDGSLPEFAMIEVIVELARTLYLPETQLERPYPPDPDMQATMLKSARKALALVNGQ